MFLRTNKIFSLNRFLFLSIFFFSQYTITATNTWRWELVADHAFECSRFPSRFLTVKKIPFFNKLEFPTRSDA